MMSGFALVTEISRLRQSQSVFLSPQKEKEVIGDGEVVKSLSVKQNVTFAGTNALARYTSSVGYAATFPSKGKAKSARLDKRGEFRGTTKCEPV